MQNLITYFLYWNIFVQNPIIQSCLYSIFEGWKNSSGQKRGILQASVKLSSWALVQLSSQNKEHWMIVFTLNEALAI